MNWEEAEINYKSFLKLEKGLSDNSIGAYINDFFNLKKYVVDTQPDVLPTDVSTSLLQDFVGYIAELGISTTTQARLISGIRSFFKFLLINDYITENPAELLDAPKTTRKIPDVLSVEDIDLILSKIDLSKPEGHRNLAIIETLYSCGLRVSELTDLKISNLFFDDFFIRVTGKGQKQRLVPISRKAIKNILIYTQNYRNNLKIATGFEDYLFLNRRGRKITRNMIFIIIKELVAMTDITKNVSPHTFRHSFATHLVEGGADLRAVQEMLGHESITTTEIYTHLDQTYLRDTILSYHPHGRKSAGC